MEDGAAAGRARAEYEGWGSGHPLDMEVLVVGECGEIGDGFGGGGCLCGVEVGDGRAVEIGVEVEVEAEAEAGDLDMLIRGLAGDPAGAPSRTRPRSMSPPWDATDTAVPVPGRYGGGRGRGRGRSRDWRPPPGPPPRYERHVIDGQFVMERGPGVMVS